MKKPLLALCLVLAAGCATTPPEPPRPFWFQKTDFTRPGDPSTWRLDDPPISVCGTILGGALRAAAGR
jgi:hypothetical protein